MSVANDKKIEKAKRREERTRKEQQEKRRLRIISIIVIVVLAVLISGAVFINSKYIRRSLTAISVGGVNFSAAEFDFFYNSTASEYSEYMTSQLGDYASAYLPTSGKSHASQIYDPETGETWADFFTAYTIEKVSSQVQYYNSAKANGFTMPDEAREAIDNEIDTYKLYADMYGISLDTFIQTYIGVNLNEKVIRNVLEFIYTASSYAESVRDSFTYTDQEIAACYAENKESMDSITYRYFLVYKETVSESDYETHEEYDEANASALEEASAIAAEIITRVNSEEDFINEAREYDPETYLRDGSTLRTYPGSWLSSDYKEWLLDENREYGDVFTADMSNGTYVVLFINRDPNEYRMVSMNQILISRQELDMDDYEEGASDPVYLEAFKLVDDAAKANAEDVMNLFVEGGATKEKLIELMADHSDDTAPEGYYDLISKNSANNKMVAEIEEWLFAPERQVGDYKLIRTEDYGYHLVYFDGFGDRYCDYLADTKLRDADYSAWEEGLAPVEAVKHWAYIFRSN